MDFNFVESNDANYVNLNRVTIGFRRGSDANYINLKCHPE